MPSSTAPEHDRDDVLHGVDLDDARVVAAISEAAADFKAETHAKRLKPFETCVSEVALSQVVR